MEGHWIGAMGKLRPLKVVRGVWGHRPHNLFSAKMKIIVDKSLSIHIIVDEILFYIWSV
jgi:hypothetical protein